MSKFKVAMIGRSNVGKSSLINYLIGNGVLAKTSKNPGKTRKPDLYPLTDRIDLVDLPGYGYAKVKKTTRESWDQNLVDLIYKDQFFKHVFVLIDSSIKPMANDKDFINWLFENQVPFSVIYTKTDKEKAPVIKQNIELWSNFFEALLPADTYIKTFKVSIKTKTGAGDIVHFIKTL